MQLDNFFHFCLFLQDSKLGNVVRIQEKKCLISGQNAEMSVK